MCASVQEELLMQKKSSKINTNGVEKKSLNYQVQALLLTDIFYYIDLLIYRSDSMLIVIFIYYFKFYLQQKTTGEPHYCGG